MKDTNPTESLEAEGVPELEDHPPGKDIETDEVSLVAPRDHSIASGSDPAYPVTAAEQRVPEGVADRAARENPDAGAEELGIGGSVQGRAIRSREEDLAEPVQPEESAVHVYDDRDL